MFFLTVFGLGPVTSYVITRISKIRSCYLTCIGPKRHFWRGKLFWKAPLTANVPHCTCSLLQSPHSSQPYSAETWLRAEVLLRKSNLLAIQNGTIKIGATERVWGILLCSWKEVGAHLRSLFLALARMSSPSPSQAQKYKNKHKNYDVTRLLSHALLEHLEAGLPLLTWG